MGVVPDVGREPRDKREEEEEEHVGDERGRRAWATWVLAGPDALRAQNPELYVHIQFYGRMHWIWNLGCGQKKEKQKKKSQKVMVNPYLVYSFGSSNSK